MRNFTVEVRWDGRAVSGLSRVGALRSTVEVITLREGGTGATFHIPGRADTAGVTIERGLDDDLTFDVWARGPVLRKAVEVAFVDTSDGLSVSYVLHDCWVCGYAVSPDLEAGTVVESLSLSVGRWQRVTPPAPELAERLAAERSAPVRRIDVGALLSAYRSETSASLEAELAEAEKADAVLLLDEADALFSRRTEVRDSHDRYADTEVGALLRRLSTYRGQVVVEPPDGAAADPS